MMTKRYKIGQKVYILPRTSNRDYVYLDRAIQLFGDSGKLPMTGQIVGERQSGDLSYHNSTLYEYYYDVLGPNNVVYKTDDDYSGSIVGIASIEEFMAKVETTIKLNLSSIENLKQHNIRYRNLLAKFRLLGN